MMTAIYETYTADFTGRIEHARRADGQWFCRSQYRDPRYGYKWTAWRKSFRAPAYADGTPIWSPDRIANVRLPKEV